MLTLRSWPVLLLVVSSIAMGGACRAPFTSFSEILRVTSDPDYIRLPVILIPGIKGTALARVRQGRSPSTIWGISGHVAGFRGFNELTLTYEAVSAPDIATFAAEYKRRAIYPGDVLLAYRLGFKWISFHDFIVYRDVVNLLVDDGKFVVDSPNGRSLFLFPYDWRLDNRFAAVQLALALPRFRDEYEHLVRSEHCTKVKRKPFGQQCTNSETAEPSVQASYNATLLDLADRYPDLFTGRPGRPPEVRFHIVAHSMGGLVGQYFLTRLGGWRDTFNFVTLGTPTKGAMDSLKAFSEGEYPDTLWSNILGILTWDKRATNFISMSFPSVFQMLPRYRNAITGAASAEDFGLGQAPALLNRDVQDRVFATYAKYNVLPDVKAVTRALADSPVVLEEPTVRQHFAKQLLSSACFHSALDDDLSDADERTCNEPGRILDAMEFLRSIYPDRYPTTAIEELTRRLDLDRTSQQRPKRFERRVVYGGHCEETLTRARFIESSRIHFLQSKPLTSATGQTDGAYYGDGRVPLESSQFLRRNEKWSTAFFLCADHVGLVKDDSFKYNLLRSVLTHFGELVPVVVQPPPTR